MDHKDFCNHTRIKLIASAIGHQQCTKTAANIIQLPGTDRVIAIGTPAEVRGLLGAAPLTAPAPLTDELQDQLTGAMYALRHIAAGGDDPAKCAQSALDVIERLHSHAEAIEQRVELDDSDFYPPRALLKREDWNPATRKPHVKQIAEAEAAPAPQQSELTDEQRKAIGRAAECVESYGRDDLAVILLEVAKAAPAAPVQAAEQSKIIAAPLGSYSSDDQAFFAFWYGHMQGDVMTGTLADVSHATARFIWDAARKTGSAPVGFISRDTLAKLQGNDLAIDEHVMLWHADNPPSRAVIPVYLAAPVQAEQAQAEPVAWMNPETLDVIHDTRKRAWENDFGMGGKAKAAGYTYRLVAPAQAEQAAAVRAAYENAAQIVIKKTGVPRDVLGPATTAMKARAKNGEAIATAIRALAAPGTATSNDTGALGEKGVEA